MLVGPSFRGGLETFFIYDIISEKLAGTRPFHHTLICIWRLKQSRDRKQTSPLLVVVRIGAVVIIMSGHNLP